MQKINFRAFTLVELIVVITIVGILSTVGFVSYSSYLTGARDSNRISQMVKLSDSLQVYSATRSLPLPDNQVEITASGTTIAYQGEVGIDVLETIDYTNGGTDPKDDSFYTYYLTKDRNSLQLMALMEEQESVASLTSQTKAQFEERFPKVYGRKLGVLTQAETNIPVQELSEFSSADFDIVNEPNEYMAHISDDEKLEGTGSTLMASNPKSSCKRIKQTGGSDGNGIYTISPVGVDFDVYCDMETSGGGWTMVAKSYPASTGTIGWAYGVLQGDVNNDTQHYALGADSQYLNFNEVMVGRYTIGNYIDYAIKFNINFDNFIIPTSVAFATSNCELIVSSGLSTDEKNWNHCAHFAYWGDFDNSGNMFFSINNTLSSTVGILPGSISAGSYTSANGAWHGEQGMVFVK